MHFQVKMRPKGRETIFSHMQTTNNLTLIFYRYWSDYEKVKIPFFDFVDTSKVECMYLAFKILVITSKNGQI